MKASNMTFDEYFELTKIRFPDEDFKKEDHQNWTEFIQIIGLLLFIDASKNTPLVIMTRKQLIHLKEKGTILGFKQESK